MNAIRKSEELLQDEYADRLQRAIDWNIEQRRRAIRKMKAASRVVKSATDRLFNPIHKARVSK